MATAAKASFTVILSDRNRHIRELLAREFAREGMAVKGCGLGREALELAASQGDLLVVDAELPDMDAPSLIRSVRRSRPGLPVAVHAHDADEAAGCLDEAGVFFVKRDDDPSGLVRAVRGALENAGVNGEGA
jgi:DNA-binding response OmpR family regulator